MKKILILFALLIVFIPNVKAEDCNLIGSYSSEDYYFYYDTWGYYLTPKPLKRQPVEIPSKLNTYYTFYFDNADSIKLTDYDFRFSGENYLNLTKSDYYYHFTTKTPYNFQIYSKSLLTDWNNLFVYSSDTDILCLPNLEPEPIVPDTSLSDFYQVTTSKLSFLATSFHENKILFSAILIPFFFSIFILVFRRLFL